MLYPPTVADDEALDTVKSSDDEMDEGVKVRKKRRSEMCSAFADGFEFDEASCNVEEVDGLKNLRQYMKIGLASTLDEKIARERVKLVNGNVEKPSLKEVPELVQEMENISDSVREKKPGKLKAAKICSFFDVSSNVSNTETCATFEQMGFSRPLCKALVACGFNAPTRIQSACIPPALIGRDICACSATGTGKTAAFMLPVLERLLFKPHRKTMTRIVVLTPTRELAIQTFQVSRQLSQFMHVDICLCAGGLDLKAQEAALRQRPDIVIATPGRLIDHLHNAPTFSLDDVEVLVLDEADRMLEEAFADQMKEIIRLCAPNRQTMLFSATMTEQVEDLAAVSLKNPVKLFINENTETALNLRQEFVRIRENHETDRESIVASLVTRNFPDHTIVFVQTKKACQRLHIVLGLLGVRAGQLHSGLTQRQRIEALYRFKKSELDVLISTDLAARGLDVEGVMTVINMHMPISLKQYIHRVGRTARAGRVGRSVSLVGESERKILKEVVASNKGKSLKQRLINADVIDAYRKRIEEMKESIERIKEEEETERAMRIAQEELRRSEAKLEGKVEKRQWIKQQKAPLCVKKNENGMSNCEKMKEAVQAQRDVEFQVRIAKRARKCKKLRAVVESDAHSVSHYGKKRRIIKKSSFTKELTAVGRKHVKQFRYGPEDADFKAMKIRNEKR